MCVAAVMAAPLPQDGLASQLPSELLDEVLKKADVPTLLKIKGVSRSWRAGARRVLWAWLCRREGQPVPTSRAAVTDVDIEPFLKAGGRGVAHVAEAMAQFPNLARMHAHGGHVHHEAVRVHARQVGELRQRLAHAGPSARPIRLLEGLDVDVRHGGAAAEGAVADLGEAGGEGETAVRRVGSWMLKRHACPQSGMDAAWPDGDHAAAADTRQASTPNRQGRSAASQWCSPC